jgi:hypothetical protein
MQYGGGFHFVQTQPRQTQTTQQGFPQQVCARPKADTRTNFYSICFS